MRVEQAVYTSLPRAGRTGYHVVARSRGVSEADARALASWSPSHGALIVDQANPASLNLHPLTEGRIALSRTCEGPPEYSGRGGRQLYTHALILGPEHLERSNHQPVSIYRDAMALGHLGYRPDPGPSLEPLALGHCHRRPDPDSRAARARTLGLDDVDDLLGRLRAGQDVRIHHPGDRILAAECLLGALPPELVATLSVSTSLRPSSARPFRLQLEPPP